MCIIPQQVYQLLKQQVYFLMISHLFHKIKQIKAVFLYIVCFETLKSISPKALNHNLNYFFSLTQRKIFKYLKEYINKMKLIIIKNNNVGNNFRQMCETFLTVVKALFISIIVAVVQKGSMDSGQNMCSITPPQICYVSDVRGKRTLLPECPLLFLAHIGWGPWVYWTPYWHATLPVSRSAPAYYVEYIALRGL